MRDSQMAVSETDPRELIEKLVENLGARVLGVCTAVLDAPALDAAQLSSENVPDSRGIYIWRRKTDGCPAYVGVALGRSGLRQRILRQHLAPGYLKSVFRKSLVASFGVHPGEDSVRFIRENFTLSLFPCPETDQAVVEHAEALLIRVLQPAYNKAKRGYRTGRQ